MVWTFAHIGLKGDDAEVGGQQVWSADWIRVEGERARLVHPQVPTRVDTYAVYEIEDDEEAVVRFAAAEVAASVWSFYWWREGR